MQGYTGPLLQTRSRLAAERNRPEEPLVLSSPALATAPATHHTVLSREQQPRSSHQCSMPDAYRRARATALGEQG